MNERLQTHLTPEEVELWATGLLSAARTFHLTECAECLALAERERKLLVELAQLQRFAPSARLRRESANGSDSGAFGQPSPRLKAWADTA